MSLYDASGPQMEWGDSSEHHLDDDDGGNVGDMDEFDLTPKKKNPTSAASTNPHNTTRLDFLADNTGSTDADSSNSDDDDDGCVDDEEQFGGNGSADDMSGPEEDEDEEELIDDLVALERLHIKAKVLLGIVDLYAAGYIAPVDDHQHIDDDDENVEMVDTSSSSSSQSSMLVADMRWNHPYCFGEASCAAASHSSTIKDNSAASASPSAAAAALHQAVRHIDPLATCHDHNLLGTAPLPANDVGAASTTNSTTTGSTGLRVHDLSTTTTATAIVPSSLTGLNKLREKVAREVVTSSGHLARAREQRAREEEEEAAAAASAVSSPSAAGTPAGSPASSPAAAPTPAGHGKRGQQHYIQCNLVGYLETFVTTLLQEPRPIAVCYSVRDRRPLHRPPTPGGSNSIAAANSSNNSSNSKGKTKGSSSSSSSAAAAAVMLPSKALEVDLATCGGARWIKVKAFSEKNARQDALGQTTDRKDFHSSIRSLTTLSSEAVSLPFAGHPDVVVATLHQLPDDVKEGFISDSGCRGIASVKPFSKILDETIDLMIAVSRGCGAGAALLHDDDDASSDSSDASFDLSGGMDAECDVGKEEEEGSASSVHELFQPLSTAVGAVIFKQTSQVAIANCLRSFSSDEEDPSTLAARPSSTVGSKSTIPVHQQCVLEAALTYARIASSTITEGLFEESPLSVRYINFDVTALVALVSDTCNGHAGSRLPKQRVLDEQCVAEVNHPAVESYLFPTLAKYTRVLSPKLNAPASSSSVVGEAIKQQLIDQELAGFDPFRTSTSDETTLDDADIGFIPAVTDITPFAVDIGDINTAAHMKQAGDATKLFEAAPFPAPPTLKPWEQLLFSLRQEKLAQASDDSNNSSCLAVNWVVSDIALSEFAWIVDTIAGDAERVRAQQLLPNLIVIPAGKFFNTQRSALAKPKPSASDSHAHPHGVVSPHDTLNNLYRSKSGVLRLVDTGKIGFRHKAVFGIGELVRAVTLSANYQFVQAAKDQGVDPCVRFHPSRALTERKRRGISRGEGPKRPPEIYPTLEKELLAEAMARNEPSST